MYQRVCAENEEGRVSCVCVTVNDEKIMDRMIALRADGIISDRPDILMKHIR